MTWRQPGDKPLSESMLVRLQTHICVTRPQWVKYFGAEAGILDKNYVNNMISNALAPCIDKLSAAILLIFWNKRVLLINEEGLLKSITDNSTSKELIKYHTR